MQLLFKVKVISMPSYKLIKVALKILPFIVVKLYAHHLIGYSPEPLDLGDIEPQLSYWGISLLFLLLFGSEPRLGVCRFRPLESLKDDEVVFHMSRLV